MGVTYKAVDINLQCAVALKVINARLIGDESARRRFVREARAAASVLHPNVASVFHLGNSGESYFYAMEFVEGESLDKVIRRSGRLEPSVALGVATRVAAGLEAIQKQNLVHRDIKPSNIMVSFDGDKIVNAKIINLEKACLAIHRFPVAPGSDGSDWRCSSPLAYCWSLLAYCWSLTSFPPVIPASATRHWQFRREEHRRFAF
jgi:serine/threonine protein kinase